MKLKEHCRSAGGGGGPGNQDRDDEQGLYESGLASEGFDQRRTADEAAVSERGDAADPVGGLAGFIAIGTQSNGEADGHPRFNSRGTGTNRPSTWSEYEHQDTDGCGCGNCAQSDRAVRAVDERRPESAAQRDRGEKHRTSQGPDSSRDVVAADDGEAAAVAPYPLPLPPRGPAQRSR
ncbi:hypothetical protein AB0B21_37490 [Streptomyces rimosus]|uniref:hypothetical protein n=1 Tax=Streptomyces rimosus TaxID=1927 RepID=UPI00131D8763|nr:hypothetical protein [Streptomyces rimosus]